MASKKKSDNLLANNAPVAPLAAPEAPVVAAPTPASAPVAASAAVAPRTLYRVFNHRMDTVAQVDNEQEAMEAARKFNGTYKIVSI